MMLAIRFAFLVIQLLLIVAGSRENVDHAAPHSVHEQHYLQDGQHNVNFDHEAILGSKDLDEEFSKLDPTEAKTRLGILIKKMDKNADSFIGREELTTWILQSFRSLDEEEATSKMSEHDKNSDGNVTWPEYLDVVYGFLPEEVREFKNDKNLQVAELGEMISLDMEKFIAADMNRDRVLNKTEYIAFMHPHDFQHMFLAENKRILRAYDKDKSGDISLKEFTQEDEFPHDNDPEQVALDRENFHLHDMNKDGVLSGDEIQAWALPDNQEAAEEEADHLIAESDKNGDGKLSEEEILSNHMLWVGSAAMDNEKMLHDAGEL